ncbi:MAG: hypothetical protein KTR25_07490 [Myxococcales bacterium]|nr:hypothetical protein [Myxococcales bacterium]
MTSVDEVERLADRYEEIQQELVDVLGSIRQIRNVLGRVPEELIEIRKVLNSIGDSTEKAAHTLLELIEEMFEEDEKDSSLALLKTLQLEGEGGQAVANLVECSEKRQVRLNEMLVQMSFQDLTCQTLQKASNRLTSLEEEIDLILSGEKHAIEALDKKHLGSMSGLSRLKEAQGTGSKQDLIDQLLSQGK